MAKPYSMRRVIFQAVRGWAERGWRIETSITKIRESQGIETRDVAAAADIAATVIKRISSLDVVLGAYCSRSRDRVEAELWTLAQVGVAQLLFRPDIPAHAAVHETVSVADEIGKPQWKGFLNGLLRGIARGLKFQDEISFVDGLQTVATQSLEDRGWAVFDRPIIDGGPEDSEWVSRVYSLPRWLTRRWMAEEWSGAETNDEFFRACNAQPRQWLRTNLERQSRDELIARFRRELPDSVIVEPGPVHEAISVQGPVILSALPGFDTGSCSVQDLTAMAAVDRLDPQPGEQILDLCAAPGGKTCHIAERLAGTGQVLATDIAKSRLRRVWENVSRLQLKNVDAILIEQDGANLPDGPFDAALVDAPCSNTGVLAKRPEARWRIQQGDLEELPQLQLRLLKRAADRVRRGGRVVYSTCSIEAEENRGVVDAFVADAPEWTFVDDQLHLPSGLGDGGYQATLVRAT